MRIASVVGAAGIGLFLVASGVSDATAQASLSSYQGAWLAGGGDCTEVFSSVDKGASFKKQVDIFAPAFIIVGNRLRTPQASCRIKSVSQTEDRQRLVLDCANAVAGSEVRVLMAAQPDGSLKRYLNERDTAGSSYQRCSR